MNKDMFQWLLKMAVGGAAIAAGTLLAAQRSVPACNGCPLQIPVADELELDLDLDDPRINALRQFYQAQLERRRPSRNSKDHRNALEEYKPVVAGARKVTARIIDPGKRGEQVAFVDLAPLFAERNAELHLDWVHPNAEGLAIIADTLHPFVGSALPAARDVNE